MIRMRLILFLFIVSGVVSCSGADNGELTVNNDSDRIIRVYYDQEVEVSDENEEDGTEVVDEYKIAEISPGESETLEIKSSITFDGYIKSSYCGILMRFDIDFNIFDQADITIRKQDFIDDVLSR
ncbi:MAG TPA: hypothetical protein PK624_04015 [Spirochaetota bacterium]|nr:hypothetical protein [Spirochaetota bacterium]HOR43940.1 hypothetical protein [Spirochaetota bacterium]HOU85050.1 hypothetical protein [Spirochaetota bacterium]HPK55364.1 hypothetical protein [Spirochaetota bacterium]HQE59452.1 hypothetical protein [Spirochaetota bacterium]